MLYKSKFRDEMSLGNTVPNSPFLVWKFTMKNSTLHALRNLEVPS